MSNVNTEGLPPELQARIAEIIEKAKANAVQAPAPAAPTQPGPVAAQGLQNPGALAPRPPSLMDHIIALRQEVEDYTWTEEGLANFSIKISKKGTGLDTRYTIMPKVRAVPAKIKSEWAAQKDTIWLPNFFEGKDPFDGKQVEEKGLPAGGTDKRGAHVSPTTDKPKADDTNEEF